MKKVLLWLKNHMPSKRRLIQLYAALLYNANIKGFISGNIYKGNSKIMCVPGMNCYSCPGAVGACPLGSLQNALSSANKKTPYYVIGILLLFGLIAGRTICGWFCPFGLVQELLYKIKSWKLKKNKVTYVLSYLKYFLLVVFAIIIPTIYGFKGIAVPAFCKYICPSGTLEGAIGLISNPNNERFLGMLGILFSWKFAVLVIFIVSSIFIFRPFCRFVCPLGALYGLFAKFNILGVQVNKKTCTDCGLCVSKCKVDIKHVGDKECVHCGECIQSCPVNAISFKGARVLINPNPEVNMTSKEVKGEELIGGNIPEEPIQEVKVKKPVNRKKIFNIVVTALCSITLIGALVYYNVIKKEKPRAVSGNNIGDQCPSLMLDGINGLDCYQIEDSFGKVVIINFWGTWCGPCVQELPYFEMIQEEYSSKVDVVAVHSGYARDTAQAYIDENWPTYTMKFVLDSKDAEYYESLGGAGEYPVTVILDKDGVIQETIYGSVPHTDLMDIYTYLKDKVEYLLHN